MTTEYLTPMSTQSVELSSEKLEIDTHCLMALVKVCGGSSFAATSDCLNVDNAFPLSEGELLRFSGKMDFWCEEGQSCVLKIIYFDKE